MTSQKLLAPLPLLLVLAACISSGCGDKLDPLFEAMLDEYVEGTFIPALDVPGLSLSIVLNNEIVLAKGYGYANIARGIMTDNTTLFGVGSITKTILATVAVKVLSEKFPQHGAGVLDAPIRELAPNYNFSFIDRYRYQSMRFRDLLAHNHCLCQSQLNLLFGASKTREEFAYRTRYEEQCCRYRSGLQLFSNSMYALAGELLASIAETDLDTLVVTTMRQMGMPYAQFYKTDGRHETLPNLSQGYYWKDEENHLFNVTLLRKIGNAPGSGAVIASAIDIGAFLLFGLNQGVYNETQVIPAAALEWQFAVSLAYQFEGFKTKDNDKVTGSLGYGLGMSSQIYDGWMWLTHSGTFGPYNSKVSAFPMKKLAVFSAVNQATRQDKSHDELHLLIFEAMRQFGMGHPEPFKAAAAKIALTKLPSQISDAEKRERESWLPKPQNVDQAKVMGNPDYWVNEWIPVNNLTGIYGHRVDGELEIYTDPINGVLNIAYGEWGLGTLHPDKTENRYRIDWVTDVVHQFYAAGTDPNYFLHFPDDETVILMQNGEGLSSYKKGAILSKEPEHLWSPDSCSLQ